MTLVARFAVRNIPFLLADTLITIGGPPEKGIRLPVMKQSTEVSVEAGPRTPVELRQKINFVGDHILAAWSGGFEDAQKAYRYLNEQLGSCQPTHELLGQLLTAMTTKFPGIDQSLSLTGYVNEPKGIRDFCWGAKTFTYESQLLGKITLLGKGYLNAASTFGEHTEYPLTSEHSTEFERSLYFALGVAAELLDDEHDDSSIPSQYGYGGIYETATWLQDKFTKIGDITYVFWKAGPEGGQVHLNMTKLIKIGYLDDILLVHTLTPLLTVNGITLARDRFEIPTMLAPDKYQPRVAPSDYPPFDSEFTHHILTEDVTDRPARQLLILDYAKKENPKPFTILEDNGRINFQFSEEFWERIRAHFCLQPFS